MHLARSKIQDLRDQLLETRNKAREVEQALASATGGNTASVAGRNAVQLAQMIPGSMNAEIDRCQAIRGWLDLYAALWTGEPPG